MGTPPRRRDDAYLGDIDGEVRQQIGMTLGIVRGLADRQGELRDEVRGLTHELRELDKSITAVQSEVAAMKKTIEPVPSLVDDRNRIAAYAVIAGIALFVTWEILHPLVTDVFRRMIG